MALIHDIKNDKNLVTLPLKHCILKKSRDTAPLTADDKTFTLFQNPILNIIIRLLYCNIKEAYME